MAQEIIREGGGWDEKSDIWSLGVVLYYLLFKSIPWVQSNSYPEIYRKMKETFVEMQEDIFEMHERQISNSLKEFITQMLQFDPEKRISWSELFNHPLVLDQQSTGMDKGQNKSKLVNKLTDPQQETAQLTQDQISVSQNTSNLGTQIAHMETVDQAFRQTIVLQKQEVENGMLAKKQFQFELEKARLFQQASNQLKTIFLDTSAQMRIPKDLYLKCQLLLNKRGLIILRSLSTLLAFGKNTNHDGMIFFPHERWDCLQRSKLFMQDLYELTVTTEMILKQFQNKFYHYHKDFIKEYQRM